MACQTKLWIKRYSQSRFGQPIPVSRGWVSIHTADVSIHTAYVAHVGGDMCHVDVSMVTWQHQRLPRVTHFLNFWVISWNSKNVPHGSPYSHVADRTVMWQVTWQANIAVEVVDCMLTWQVNLQLVDVAQWLVSTWPSHGLPCGSGKMPNEDPRMKFQK
jgi:hypothetical protein